jgi:hypothetical protein
MKPTARLGCLLVLSVLVCACNASAGSTATAEAQPTNPPLGKGTAAQNLTNAYLVVQARLALDDFSGARAAFGGVRSTVQVAELTLAPELRKRIETATSQGAAAPDLARLRNAFAPLTEALLDWWKAQLNPLSEALLIAHCPMAMDGKGARWVQRGTALKNPYFGSQMLACGSVEGSLPPAKKS